MHINNSTIYLTDNGAALCGLHLGVTARTTGHDLSGMQVKEVTPELARAAHQRGWDVSCERCGRKASLLAPLPILSGRS